MPDKGTIRSILKTKSLHDFIDPPEGGPGSPDPIEVLTDNVFQELETRAKMSSAWNELVGAVNRMSALWLAMQDAEPENYPSYLPSFDEFAADIAEVKW